MSRNDTSVNNNTPANTPSVFHNITLTEMILFLMLSSIAVLGTLYSQTLIFEAKLFRLHNSILNITESWYDFKETYDGIPGDYPFAKTQIDSSLINGDGDQQVDTKAEQSQLWHHLSFGLIRDASFHPTRARSQIDNGFGKPMEIRFGDYSINSHLLKGHKYTNTLLTGSNIPIKVLATLDLRYDDGKPLTGKIQIAKPYEDWTQDSINQCLNIQSNQYKNSAGTTQCNAIVLTLF